MSKYRHVAVTLSDAVGRESRFTLRVESSMRLLTVVLDQISGWRLRNPGCTVYPDSHAGRGMAVHVFARPSEILFSVYVAEIEPEYLTDELRRMKPTDRWGERKVVDEAFRSFEADLDTTAVPEAA